VDAAIAWAKGLPEDVDRNEIIRGALIGLSSAKPADALDKVGVVPAGGRQGYFATTTGARVLAEAVKTDYDATIKWIIAHPNQLGREDLMGMASIVTDKLNSDPAAFLKRHLDDGSLASIMPAFDSAIINQAGGQRAAVWDWIKTQPDTEVIRELRRQIINSAGYQDPDLALKLMADMPPGREGDESVQQLASSLMNGGQMLNRLDGLMAQAPERLRGPLLSTAFQYLNGDNIGDPQKWIDRLSQTQEDQRVSNTSRIASAWAQQAPEDAVTWATALPAGAGRSSAVSSVAAAWANKDSYAASEWIATLPPSQEKDNASASLVRSIVSDSPAEAWQWALAIEQTDLRNASAVQTLQAMQKRDPATARQWLEAAPFTPQEKAQMRASMENPSAPNSLRRPQ
jgi:hypothetical protein